MTEDYRFGGGGLQGAVPEVRVSLTDNGDLFLIVGTTLPAKKDQEWFWSARILCTRRPPNTKNADANAASVPHPAN